MSQKPRSFQPKRTGGGQKFSKGGKPGGAGRGRGFSKESEGDRGERRAPRRFDRDSRPPRRDGDGFKSDRPRGKSFGDRDSRPFGSKPPYKKKSEFGDKSRPARSGGDGFKSDRPRKSFDERGDRPARSGGGDKPFKKRSFSGAPEKRGRDFSDKPRKPFSKDRRFEGEQRRPAPRRFEERQPEAARDDIRQKLKSDRPSYGAPSASYLYGVHAVSEALLNPHRKHKRLLCTDKGFESIKKAWDEAEGEGLDLPHLTTVEKEDIDRLLPRDAVHQDVLLDCAPLEETFLADVLISAGDDAKVLVLDQVTDPHNVGAILRSAAAFGAVAVIVQTLHAPEITGVLAKTASGAVEHVPMVREVNLSRALEQLKKAGFFCIGLDEDGTETLAQMNISGKTALVLGAEGAGLRRLVAESCDALAHLPTQGAIGSLNVSNAAAVALYEAARNRK